MKTISILPFKARNMYYMSAHQKQKYSFKMIIIYAELSVSSTSFHILTRLYHSQMIVIQDTHQDCNYYEGKYFSIINYDRQYSDDAMCK